MKLKVALFSLALSSVVALPGVQIASAMKVVTPPCSSDEATITTDPAPINEVSIQPYPYPAPDKKVTILPYPMPPQANSIQVCPSQPDKEYPIYIENLIYYLDGEKDNGIQVDGKQLDKKDFTVYGKNGQLMIPLRLVSEAMGYEVSWDNESKMINLQKGSQYTQVKIDEDSYFFARMAPISLGVAPEIVEGKTYVPLRFVPIILKARTIVDGNQMIAIISNPVHTLEEAVPIQTQ